MPEVSFVKDSLFDGVKYIDLKDKDSVVRLYVMSMLERTNCMFEWKGLPSTIPQDILERTVQTVGCAGIIKKGDKLFCVNGKAGGVRNYNYQPTKLIVSNPYLLVNSEAYNIYYGKDSEFDNPVKDDIKTEGECVVIQNDTYYAGLLPLSNFYASQLTENTLSKHLTTILARVMYIFNAPDDDVAEDFRDMMASILKGDFECIVNESLGIDGSQLADTLPFAEKIHEALTDLIESEQYLKASWFNDFGLQANYNMKRESLNSNESQLNRDATIPLVDHMLAMRKLACTRINELFGVNWSVEFSSAWKIARDAIGESVEAIDETTEMEETVQTVEDGVNEETVQTVEESEDGREENND